MQKYSRDMKNDSASDDTASITENARAYAALSSPEAKGREHFSGLRRSLSRSIMSLMMYIPLEARQNDMNTADEVMSFKGVKRLPLNRGAENTRRFFVHCCTRISRSMRIIFLFMAARTRKNILLQGKYDNIG